MTTTNDQILDEGEAYLSFGGWAQKVSEPPRLHERRRYTVDVECTEAAIKTSEKGDRFTRKLSILRVSQVAGVVPPPKNEDENQGELFDEEGNVVDDDASADEGDEIMAERNEAKAAAAAGPDVEIVDTLPDGTAVVDGEEWPGGGDGTGDADDVAPDEKMGEVTNLFKEAKRG